MVANDNTSMGLNYRRRVIYHALHATFSDPQELRRVGGHRREPGDHEMRFVAVLALPQVEVAADFLRVAEGVVQRLVDHPAPVVHPHAAVAGRHRQPSPPRSRCVRAAMNSP